MITGRSPLKLAVLLLLALELSSSRAISAGLPADGECLGATEAVSATDTDANLHRTVFQINVFHAESPEKLEALPSDVVSALKRLDEAYRKQATNTVDVFAEQNKLKGKTVYYLVAKDEKNDIAGLFAVIIASAESPTSLAQFGVVDKSPVQIELGKLLVLRSGRGLMRSLVKRAVQVLMTKNFAPETPVYFWADDPDVAGIYSHMGAPQIHINQKGIWAFGAPLGAFVKKFTSTGVTP